MSYIERVKEAIEPYRQQVIQHQVYSSIEDLHDLRIFMQHHVFAVWDFMSLLKALQVNLTCTRVPWVPVGDGDTRHLINEIVAGEESDVDQNGHRKSHFELYLDAMQQAGANLRPINQFVYEVSRGMHVTEALAVCNAAPGTQKFVNYTFDTIASKKLHNMAAVFTFGREDLIPGMFMSLVGDLHRQFPGSMGTFKYYLERHIEVDGDHHSQLAIQMVANLCGNNAQLWQQVEAKSIESLQMRCLLWDAVLTQILQRKEKHSAGVAA